jgi:hypothetical protein
MLLGHKIIFLKQNRLDRSMNLTNTTQVSILNCHKSYFSIHGIKMSTMFLFTDNKKKHARCLRKSIPKHVIESDTKFRNICQRVHMVEMTFEIERPFFLLTWLLLQLLHLFSLVNIPFTYIY